MKKEMERTQRTSKKIRKGDKVIAIAGNYRGQSGTVLRCLGDKIVVQGLNVRKRHMKGQGNQPGRIVELEKPINISNLRVCNAENQPLKLKVRFDDKGQKELYYKKNGDDIVYRSMKKSK